MIILFNGPPGCGKDTICNLLSKEYGNSKWVAFARHLKFLTHVMYGYYDRPWDYYESCKDIPTSDFDGLTPRQAYIRVSEDIIKPNFGKQYFGKALLRGQLAEVNPITTNVFVSDSGFVEEAEPVGEEYGFDNLLQVKIMRPNHTFANDSRTYWTHPKIKSITVSNIADIDNYLGTVIMALGQENALL